MEFGLGDWRVVPSRNVVARNGDETRLEPRVMDLLVALAERAGEPVSKDELAQRVWKQAFVSDDVLTVAVSALRKTLGDDARNPRYIETVSRRGYRLIAPVRRQGAPAPVAPEPQPRVVAAPRRRPKKVVAVVAALVLVAATWTTFGARTNKHVPTAESHEAYVKGRYFLDQRSVRAWQQALDNFRRAIALDEENPAAHAGLADTYSMMADVGVASPAEMRPLAMRSVERAMALDPHSAEALEALGRAQFLFDWDFESAERNLSQAVALDGDYMPAYQALAWVKSVRGKHGEASAAARAALQLDPVNTARYTEHAWVLALGGRSADALREVDRALQLNPRAWEIYVMKGAIYEAINKPDSAFGAYLAAWRASGVTADSLERLESWYRDKGMQGYYRELFARRSTFGPTSETWTAQLHLKIGERDRAIETLERALEKREGALAWVHVDPVYQPLRSDPRFQRLAAQVGGGSSAAK